MFVFERGPLLNGETRSVKLVVRIWDLFERGVAADIRGSLSNLGLLVPSDPPSGFVLRLINQESSTLSMCGP